MKITLTILLLAVGLVSVLSSSGENIVAHPDHQTTAAIAADNARSDGPDTFGNPLVEF
jgi:hypothetical protein